MSPLSDAYELIDSEGSLDRVRSNTIHSCSAGGRVQSPADRAARTRVRLLLQSVYDHKRVTQTSCKPAPWRSISLDPFATQSARKAITSDAWVEVSRVPRSTSAGSSCSALVLDDTRASCLASAVRNVSRSALGSELRRAVQAD